MVRTTAPQPASRTLRRTAANYFNTNFTNPTLRQRPGFVQKMRNARRAFKATHPGADINADPSPWMDFEVQLFIDTVRRIIANS